MAMSNTDASSVTQVINRVNCLHGFPLDPRIEFFDRHAASWDADAEEVARTLRRLEELRDRVGLKPGHNVLELGCGTGRITRWLADIVRPGRVVASDFSPAMLAQARSREVPAELRLMDICAEASADDQYDVVFCFHSFPHFRDPSRALRNIRALLGLKGQLIVMHLAGSAEINIFHSRLAHPVCHDLLPSPEAWPQLLAGAGLELISLTDEAGLFLLRAGPVGQNEP
jgi:SAM-dependent methyltransferase